MQTKYHLVDNGAFITFERSELPHGMYFILLRDPAGEVHTKIRCNAYSDALAHYRRLCKVAKTL